MSSRVEPPKPASVMRVEAPKPAQVIVLSCNHEGLRNVPKPPPAVIAVPPPRPRVVAPPPQKKRPLQPTRPPSEELVAKARNDRGDAGWSAGY